MYRVVVETSFGDDNAAENQDASYLHGLWEIHPCGEGFEPLPREAGGTGDRRRGDGTG